MGKIVKDICFKCKGTGWLNNSNLFTKTKLKFPCEKLCDRCNGDGKILWINNIINKATKKDEDKTIMYLKNIRKRRIKFEGEWIKPGYSKCVDLFKCSAKLAISVYKAIEEKKCILLIEEFRK